MILLSIDDNINVVFLRKFELSVVRDFAFYSLFPQRKLRIMRISAVKMRNSAVANIAQKPTVEFSFIRSFCGGCIVKTRNNKEDSKPVFLAPADEESQTGAPKCQFLRRLAG